MADLSNSALVTDPDDLALMPVNQGGDGAPWAPGTFKVVIEKCENKANREATNYSPTTTLKIIGIVECEDENAEAAFIGKKYLARNPTKTSNVEKSKEHQIMLAKLIKICGKMGDWKDEVAAKQKKQKPITDDLLCYFINEECSKKVLLLKLSYQWNHDAKKQEANAKGEKYKPYFDHEFLPIEAEGEAAPTPARVNEAPVMEKNTATAAATADENPFG